MSRWSPEPKNGLTPINETVTSAEVNRGSAEVRKSMVTPQILVKENSATSFLSDTSSQETNQNQRSLSGNSIRPIIASATRLHPGQKKTATSGSSSSKKLKYGLIAIGVIFIIITIVVLACIPLYLPKKSTTTTQSKLI